MIKQFVIFLGASFCCHVILCQNDSTSYGEIQDAELIIEKNKRISLPKTNKIYQLYHAQVPVYSIPEFNYNLLFPDFVIPEFKSTVQKPTIEELKTQDNLPFFIKLAGGNYKGVETLASYFHSNDSYRVNLNASHSGHGEGPIRGARSARSLTEVGGSVMSYNTRKPGSLILNYSRDRFYNYGYDDDNYLTAKKSDQFYTGLQISNSFKTQYVLLKPLGERSSLKIEPGWQSINMVDKETAHVYNQENTLALSGFYRYRFNDSKKLNVDIYTARTRYLSGFTNTRGFLSIAPYIELNEGKLTSKIGMTLHAVNESGSQVFLLPKLDAKVQLNPDWHVYTHWDSKVDQNLLEEIFESSRWLEDSLLIKSSIHKIVSRTGVIGNLSDQIEAEISVGFKRTKNMLFLKPSGSDSVRYTGVYDNGKTRNLSLEARINYNIHNIFSVSSQIILNDYRVGGIHQAWFVPTREMHISLQWYTLENLTLFSTLDILSGIKATDYQGFNIDYLNTIFDWSLTLEYEINNSISFYISGYNLTNQHYEKFLNYPVIGTNFKGGLTVRF